MNSVKTIFAQLMEFVPAYEFRKCVDRYNGNFKMKSFSCWDQYLCMAFAQLAYRESLRDIEACVSATQSKLYHPGIRGKVSRNTSAHANQTRDWRIYADFAQILITRTRKLYPEDSFCIELDQAFYALGSTPIDLCLALFPWAEFLKRKDAIKLHTLLDLRGNIPSVVIITTGKVHDVNILDNLIIEAGVIYVMDRGYLDFARLYKVHQNLAFFVTRTKRNFSRKRLYSNPVGKSQGIQFDQIVTLKGYYPKKDYPEKLCRIGYLDSKSNQSLVFLTNNFVLPAKTIADIHRCRSNLLTETHALTGIGADSGGCGCGTRSRHIYSIGLELGMPTGIIAKFGSSISEQNALLVSTLLPSEGGIKIGHDEVIKLSTYFAQGCIPVMHGMPPL